MKCFPMVLFSALLFLSWNKEVLSGTTVADIIKNPKTLEFYKCVACTNHANLTIGHNICHHLIPEAINSLVKECINTKYDKDLEIGDLDKSACSSPNEIAKVLDCVLELNNERQPTYTPLEEAGLDLFKECVRVSNAFYC